MPGKPILDELESCLMSVTQPVIPSKYCPDYTRPCLALLVFLASIMLVPNARLNAQASCSMSSCVFLPLVINPYPDLFIGDAVHKQILRYDGATGTLKGAFSLEVIEPHDLIFGPDNNLYLVSDYGEVVRFNGVTGAFIDTFIPRDDEHLIGPPWGLVFGPDSHLYLCDTATDRILRYNGLTGAFIDVFAEVSLNGEYYAPIKQVFGPDENLYIVSGLTGQVTRYNGTTGEFIDVFVPPAEILPYQGMPGPFGIVFGPDRNLYLTSPATDQVLRYNGTNGAFIDAFVSAQGDEIDRPVGLGFGPDGNLYVSNYRQVLRYQGQTGEFIDVFLTVIAQQSFSNSNFVFH